MATQENLNLAQQLYVAYYGRPADAAGQTFWADQIEENGLAAAVEGFGTSDEYTARFGDLSNEELVNNLYQQAFNRDADQGGLDFYVEKLESGELSLASIALTIVENAADDDAQDATVLANKVAAADAFTDAAGDSYAGDDTSTVAADFLSNVGETAATEQEVDDAVANLPEQPQEPTDGESIRLTQRADDLEGTDGDDVFDAPVTQNETGSGVLANTFETGDVLNGGEGTDTLRADLIATGTVQDNANGVAISAETDSIENVFLRGQAIQQDNGAQNTTAAATIDAQNMEGVEQWWSDNSRAQITIEDIRSATQDTTFGMRETDPDVGYTAYFNPLYLEGDTSSDSELSLVIQEIDGDEVLAANELENITVREVNFAVGGEDVTLESDDISAANTWEELETAIAAELEAQELEGLSVSHSGNGQFVIDDEQGRAFEIEDGEALIFGASADIDVRNRVEVGRLEQEGPTQTNVVLDGAGGGSEGGALNIGANSGGRGVEVFNTVVDSDSHLSLMSSVNGQAFNGTVPNEYLQVVNLENAGDNGDLQVGTRSNNEDNRANNTINDSGLTNVREVNGASFLGDLNIGLQLTDNAIARYLDPATEQVDFNYTGGEGNDVFNIADNSTGGAVSSDQDFALNVSMGAGDDRLILDVANVNDTIVDGGEGANSIVVAQSHGTTAANTFEEFGNFQTYEVEGSNDTAHNFTTMPGVEDVIVATDGGDDTQLINMEAEQSVTVSGKNQTVGNNSTDDQSFDVVQLTNDQGAERTVTLDNTARLSNSVEGVRQDGVLTVNTLLVDSDDELDGDASEVRDLTIDSSGERTSANAIANLTAAAVESLSLTGTQDLSLNIESLANQTPATAQTAIDVDASALTGDLSLALDGDQLASIAGNGTDTVVGTAGENDTLMVHGAIAADNELNATGFEALQFGTQAAPMYGDLQLNAVAAGGTFNATSVATSEFNIANVDTALELDNLGNGAVVNLGDANRDSAGDVVNAQTLTETITLDSGADAGEAVDQLDVNLLSVLDEDQKHTLAIEGYEAIDLDVAHAANTTDADGDTRTIDLTLDEDARQLNITGGDLEGGNDDTVYDTLTLDPASELPNALSTVDISGYAGEVTLDMESDVETGNPQTDVRFVMSENSADVTLSNGLNDISDIEHNSIFEFTGEKGDDADVSSWTIENAVAFADNSGTNPDGSTENATILDVSELGIGGYDALDIIDVGGGTDTRIVSEAQNDAGEVSWEITLTGVNAADVTEENFTFA